MARPTLRGVRDNIDAIAINKTGLANDQCFKLRILEREYAETGNPAIGSVLNKNQQMQERQRTLRRSSAKPRTLRQASDRPRRRDFNPPEGFNHCGVAAGRSFASVAGERMEKKQQGFPDIMRHTTTINNMILPLDTADAKRMLDTCPLLC